MKCIEVQAQNLLILEAPRGGIGLQIQSSVHIEKERLADWNMCKKLCSVLSMISADSRLATRLTSIAALEELGRVRLSRSFFMRDFLYSEIANFYGIPNIPENPNLAIEVGTRLCDELLEPLNATFGRIAIRSAYRSPTVNALGNEKGHNCASNEKNYAGHIWDHLDAEGGRGATACVVVPWFADRYAHTKDWRPLAYWIHDHLPYSRLQFFPKLAAFNINWHDRPKRSIFGFADPKGYFLRGGEPDDRFKDQYRDFPEFRRG